MIDPLEMKKAVKPERLDKSQKAHPCRMLHQKWVCITWLVGVVKRIYVESNPFPMILNLTLPTPPKTKRSGAFPLFGGFDIEILKHGIHHYYFPMELVQGYT